MIFNQVNTEQELTDSIQVIRESFLTVAREFNLTTKNAPTNPAFIEIRHLHKMREKGIAMFSVLCENIQIGFVAVEKNEEGFYMERLAVLPEYRHKGYGRRMVEFVTDYIAEQGGDTVLIGVNGSHEIVKAWYQRLGFVEFNSKHFTHIPFPVCYMRKSCGKS